MDGDYKAYDIKLSKYMKNWREKGNVVNGDMEINIVWLDSCTYSVI